MKQKPMTDFGVKTVLTKPYCPRGCKDREGSRIVLIETGNKSLYCENCGCVFNHLMEKII